MTSGTRGTRTGAGVLALALLLLPACRRAAPSRLAEIRMASVPYLSFAPLFIAEEEGDFRREGIAIRWTALESNTEATAALAAGHLDASGGVLSIGDLRAIESGAGFRVVADKGHEEAAGCGFTGLLVRPGFPARGGLPRASDLAGARVRVIPLTEMDFLLDRFLAREGVPPSAIRKVSVPAAVVGRAFANGAVDMALIGDPERTRLLSSGDARLWMPATDFLPGFQLAYIVFGRRLLGPARPLGVRFLKAYLRGIARYRTGKTPRNVEILSRRTGLAPALVRDSCWVPVRADGEIVPTTLDAFQEWAVARGAMKQPIPLSRIWDPGPLRQARLAARGD